MSKHRFTIDTEKCKSCGLCVYFCKPGALKLSKLRNQKSFYPVEHTDPEKCTGCGNCYLVCPEAVIKIERVNNRKTKKNPQSRPAA